MLHSLSRADLGGRYVTVANPASFLLACAHVVGDQDEVGFGDGFELALAAQEGGDAKAPEWVQLFPAGPVIKARDERRWTLPDPNRLVTAFAANQADLPIDVEHASEILAPQGKEAPAHAWIKEIQVRADRTTWARVGWTAEGARKVVAGEYRYISPAFFHTKAGEIIAVKSAALVTQPALTMPALAGRDRGSLPTKENHNMSTFLGRLIAACGLAASATEDEIVAAVTSQVSLAADTRNPEKFVPAADLVAALARATTAEGKLEAIETEAATKAAEASVDEAIAAGKLAPASRAHWLSIAQSTPDAFKSAVAAMPVVLKVTDTGKKPGAEGEGENGLTAEQLSLCSQLGVAPAEYAKTLKETAQ